jgi:phosphatidylethanolamine-binding protein (PEBP) family uncharacterized protein
MSFISRYIEWALGTLLFRRRGYDHDLFHKGLAFEQFPNATFEVSSPDCGATGAELGIEYSQLGARKVPQLTWPAGGPEVKEYVIVSEDPDAPLGHSNVHGIYCLIPGSTTSFGPADLELSGDKLSSGYRWGKNRRNIVYIAPRPPLGHGPHRYFFEVIALSEPLSAEKLSAVPTKQELSELIVGKVCGWGLWTATFEHKW